MDMILGILLGESYSGIHVLSDLSVCILIIPTLGKVLASLTSPHNVLCVLNHGGPIEPLLKGLTHQGFWCYMVATSPRVYILQESFPVFYGYVTLQDSARAFMMNLVIPHNVGFSSLAYSIGLIPVDREDAMS
jgi:hypothetical protein